jgi:uncharacterized protein (DUF1015 family)
MSEAAGVPLISTFHAERFGQVSRLSDLIAPPYDVLSDDRRRQLAEADPHNIVHLIKPEGKENKYELAAQLASQWRKEGILRADEQESVYVVRQEFEKPDGLTAVRTGVIGAVAVEPFSKGRVKPHAKTYAEPKVDRLALLSATNSMFEALLLLARDEKGLLHDRIEQVLTSPPSAQAELEGVKIALWQVVGGPGNDIALAASEESLYLADGHHRYEAALEYRKLSPRADRTLGLVVPLEDPGLTILPMHRLVHGDVVDVNAVVQGLQGRFHIHELTPEADFADYLRGLTDRGTACVVVRKDGSALSLLLKAGAKIGDLPFANEPTIASLDVARVDEMVVKPLLALAGDTAHMQYSADPCGVIGELMSGTASAAVMLNATSVEQVVAVADAGLVMPYKATYFTPKVPSGLVTVSWAGREPDQLEGQ